MSFSESFEGGIMLLYFVKKLYKDPRSLGSRKRVRGGTWTYSGLQTLDLLSVTYFSGCRIAGGREQLSTPSLHCTAKCERLIWEIRSYPQGYMGLMVLDCQFCHIHWSRYWLSCRRFVMERGNADYISKAGKPSHTLPKDYRPISLSSFPKKKLRRVTEPGN